MNIWRYLIYLHSNHSEALETTVTCGKALAEHLKAISLCISKDTGDQREAHWLENVNVYVYRGNRHGDVSSVTNNRNDDVSSVRNNRNDDVSSIKITEAME